LEANSAATGCKRGRELWRDAVVLAGADAMAELDFGRSPDRYQMSARELSRGGQRRFYALRVACAPSSLCGRPDQWLVRLRLLQATSHRVEDCARVVQFLITDLSGYMTGQCIAIDGGLVWSA
jgi:NAD(P)-dependent dehydrogenase (short-subunit alcohol dehydrogenase family)